MSWPYRSRGRILLDVAVSLGAVALAINHFARPGGFRSPGNGIVVLAGLVTYWVLVVRLSRTGAHLDTESTAEAEQEG